MLNTNFIPNTSAGRGTDEKYQLLSGKMKIISAAVIALIFTYTMAFSQLPLKEWDVQFGGSKKDELSALQQTTDGGYISGGSSLSGISGDKTQASRGKSDYWIVKTDANGVKEWDARFGGSENDYLHSLQQTSDGGYILGGTSESGISGDKTQESQGLSDYWIVKTDENGVKQWDARFGGSNLDFCNSVLQTTDGGYILGGSSSSGISGDKTQANWGCGDYWIVKTDANGVKDWDARFGGSMCEGFHSLRQTSDGGYIFGGSSQSGISGDKTQESQGLEDYWIVKTDANGVKQWDTRFGGSDIDALFSLRQTTEGGYIFGGFSGSGISGDKTQSSQGLYDYWIVKTDANGVKQWDARFGGSEFDELTSLQQTTDGGYILGGGSKSDISGDKTQTSLGGQDYWIVKTDAFGTKEWDARFGGSSKDVLQSLQQTTDGGYILGGHSKSGISGDKSQASQGGYDYWIVKTDAGGSFYCYTPPNLVTTNITATTAKLKWDAVAGATSYSLRYKIATTGSWTGLSPTGHSKTIENLSANTKYVWQIKTICGVDPKITSDWSAKQFFTTAPFKLATEIETPLVEVYPNAISTTAVISLSLQKDAHAVIELFDFAGRKLQIIIDENLSAGDHEVMFHRGRLSAGIYLLRVKINTEETMRKIVIQ